MKKILISFFIVLLIVFAYIAIFNGISIGNVSILSVEQIIQENDNLTNGIEQLKSLLKKDFASKKEQLSTSVIELLQRKEEYFDLAKISTEGEIAKANTEETYLIEYLWTRIGRHATSEGVNLKMDVKSADAGETDIKNLSFTINGEYIGIIQFLSALEDDDKLSFKIENFEISSNEENLTATFIVRNVRIKTETISSTELKPEQGEENTIQNTIGNTGENETNTDTNILEDSNAVQENIEDINAIQ